MMSKGFRLVKPGKFTVHSKASCVSKDTGDKVIVPILLDSVVSSRDGKNVDGLHPCSSYEADTRTLPYEKDSMHCGFESVMIRTVDRDVVVLAVAHFQGLPNTDQFWMPYS